MFLRHGPPKELLSDRGVQFLSNTVKTLLQTLNVKQLTTTAYHPQCNGLTERFNKTLCDIISMYVSPDQKDWDELVPFAVYAYNTSKQISTGETPFRLMFARDPVSPIVRALNIPIDKNYAQSIYDSIDFIRKIVKERLDDAQASQAFYFDKKHRFATFKPGELVLVFRPTPEVGKTNKFQQRYIGPFQILRQTSEVDFEVLDVRIKRERKLIDIVHVSRLKKYALRDPVENVSADGVREEVARKVYPDVGDIPKNTEVKVAFSPDCVGGSNPGSVHRPQEDSSLMIHRSQMAKKSSDTSEASDDDLFLDFSQNELRLGATDNVRPEIDELSNRLSHVTFKPGSHSTPAPINARDPHEYTKRMSETEKPRTTRSGRTVKKPDYYDPYKYNRKRK